MAYLVGFSLTLIFIVGIQNIRLKVLVSLMLGKGSSYV
jgi:hypothetical protein